MGRKRKKGPSIGDIIDSWTIIDKINDPKKGECYKVECVCGNIRIKKRNSVIYSRGKQCSDCQYKNRTSSIDPFIEIGKKYGKWTVIRFVKVDNKEGSIFETECECKYRRFYSLSPLRNGKSKQCYKCQREWLKKDRLRRAMIMRLEKNLNQ